MWYEYNTVKQKLPSQVRESWTVKEILENLSALENRLYLIDAVNGDRYTYKETNEMANKFANAFLNLGLSKEDRIGIYLTNSPEYIFALFGCGKAGIVEIPINTSFRETEIAHIVNSAEISTILVEANKDFLTEIKKVSDATPVLKKVLLLGKMPEIPSMLASVIPFNDEIAKADTSNPKTAIYPNDTFCAFFTSGTTGLPKGAPISNECFALAAKSFLAAPVTHDDRNYTCLPLFHANAQCYSMMGTACLGSSLALSNRFSPKRFFAEIMETEATYFNYIGGILSILDAHFATNEVPDHGAKLTLGAPTVPQGWEEKFNVIAMEMYSMSEVPVLFGNVHPDISRKKRGSFGVPLFPDLGRQTRVVDDLGNDVEVGDVGELIQKGPGFVTEGYIGNPEATKETIDAEGWFHTGDLVKQDKDGYHYYVDRKKFMIRKAGENIATAEIEAVINSHPAVESSAAIAAPDPIREEEVKVLIKLGHGTTIDFEEIIEHCSTRLAYYKVPRYIEIVETFPKTPTERIQKMKLKERESQMESHGWDRDKEIPDWKNMYYGKS
jgi:crotonobetaine/carnitine-CoA ligase